MSALRISSQEHHGLVEFDQLLWIPKPRSLGSFQRRSPDGRLRAELAFPCFELRHQRHSPSLTDAKVETHADHEQCRPNSRPSAKSMRREIIEMITAAKSGHPGGSLSAVEIVVTLYFDVMRHDPANPKWPDRDRFILSKGHAARCCMRSWPKAAIRPKDQLNTLRKLGSIIGPSRCALHSGLEASPVRSAKGCRSASAWAGGPPRQRPVAHLRHAGRRRNPGRPGLGSRHVRASTSSTTSWPSWITTGSSWMASSRTSWMEPLADKWRAFGWHTIESTATISGARSAHSRKPRPPRASRRAHRAHHQGQGRFVHGEQSQVPRRRAHAGRNETRACRSCNKCRSAKHEIRIEDSGWPRAKLRQGAGGTGPRESQRRGLRRRSFQVHHDRLYFAKEFPDRFFECGIAEANMVAIGAGLASAGKIPFVSSFSVFRR